ncbi:MAG: transcription termination/antitermination protein NusA [Firmicutes bacterium]|nr:transcription termination/antitermination protein NusA [Bacillota bacterium]
MNGKEFIKALDNIVEEKNISPEVIYEAMQLALQTAYKKNFDSKTNVRVDINKETGEIKVFSYLVVVDEYDDGSEIEDEEGNIVKVEPSINRDAQILLEDALKIAPGIKVGETIEKEVTPKDFGRVATGTAKQVVMQKIREAEKNSIISEFENKEYELMIGLVALEDQKNYYIDLGRTRGILPKTEIIPGEEIVMGSNIKVYITKIENNTKGPLILLSRKHYGFIKRLFEHEIPELADGTITMHQVVREPGLRCKVALSSNYANIDPIGACIGEKGTRIASILKELGQEKINLVLYSNDPVEYIKKAMTPAKDVIVSIPDPEKREALVVVNEDNLSLAIGKKGSNIKLASKLTKYKLELKTMEQINKEGNK